MTDPTHLLTVLTPDRRGIIADISGVLQRAEGRLIQLSQTVAHDYFTVIVVFALPVDSAVERIVTELRERLSESAVVTLTPYRASRRPGRQGEQYVLTATGGQSADAVATLSALVAERGGNFTDFDYRADDERLSVIAEVELPADSALDQLQIDLQHAGAAAGLQVRLQHQKLFVATNEIAFRRVNYDS